MAETITYNFYEGSQNVERIDHQVNNYNYFGAGQSRSDTPRLTGEMPAELTTQRAERMMKALQEAGIVDEEFRVCDASLSKQAIVAEEMSKKLFIGEDIRWSLFEQMWGVKNLRSVKKSLNVEFRKKVKESLVVATQKIKI